MATSLTDENIQDVSSYRLTDYNTGTMGEGDSPNPLMGNIVSPNFDAPTQGTSIGGFTTNYDRSKYDPAQVFVHDLQNLESIREGNQGVLDSLARSTANFIGKTGLNVIGGIGGTAYGIIDAIGNGEFRRVWDNDFNRAVDSASESVGDYFRVYKSGDYQDMNIIQKMVLHPIQFTDEFMDTLSFTAGAVVTEMLTSGIATGLVSARALKYLKNIDKASKASRVGENMGSLSQKFMHGLGNGGNLTRQLTTGAAWEASVEARHTAKQMEEDMIREWQEENPFEQITDEVLDDIARRSTNAGMFTFLTNIALVGGSNIMQFPRIFRNGYNTAKRGAKSRIGWDQEANKFKDIATSELSKSERLLRNIGTGVKNPFMEGLVEEGGQGVISGIAADYWDRKNDDESKSNVDRFLNAFGKAFIDTYTTKEGWNEIGMGMLIGSIGAPGRGMLSVLGRDSQLGQQGFNEDGTRRELWTGGIAGAFQERDRRDQEVAELVDRINNNTDFTKAAKAHYDFLVKSYNLQKEQDFYLDAEDVFNYKNIEDDLLFSYISSRIDAGLNSDLDTLLEQFKSTSANDFYAAFREENDDQSIPVSENEKRKFKEDSISSLERRIKNIREAYEVVDLNYTGDNSDLREELIYSIASAKNLDNREDAINNTLSQLTGGHVNNDNLRNSNPVPVSETVKILKKSLENTDMDEAGRKEIENAINLANTLLKNTKDATITSGEADLLAEFIINNPTDASINFPQVAELLSDSRKLRNLRGNLIDKYNSLFTKKGQEDFAKHQEELVKLKEERDRQIKIAEEKKREFERKAAEDLKVKNKQQEIKEKAEKLRKEKEQIEEAPPVTLKDEVTPSTEKTTQDTPVSEESLLTEEELATTTTEESETPSDSKVDYNGQNYTVSPDGTVTNNKTGREIKKGSKVYKGVMNTLTPADSSVEQQKSDIRIGKIPNTEYEVKANGVYFKGKKLDNPKNLSHKELIAEDIGRRRQEEQIKYGEVAGDDEGLAGERISKRLEIDAKYDEELDALESTEIEEQSLVYAETGLTKSEQAVLTILEHDDQVKKQKELESDGNVIPASPTFLQKFKEKFKAVIDATRKRTVGNTIISLNIEYVENVLGDVRNKRDEYDIWDQYDENGDLLINDNFDSRLQDPSQFKPGDTVNIIFPTFEQIEERGISFLTGEGYTQEMYDRDITNLNSFPVAFTDVNGKIIGYLPTTENVAKRVSKEHAIEEINKNIELRERLFNNQNVNYKVKIVDKSHGTPMFSQNSRRIYDALGDGTRLSEGVRIGIFKKGNMRDGLNSVVTDMILPEGITPNEAFEEGRAYVIVPSAKVGQSFAFNADVSRLSRETANSIVRMIQLFRANPEFKRDSDLIQERESLSREIDFSDYVSFTTAIEQLLYVDGVNHIFEIDTKNNKLRLGITKDLVFELDEFMTNEKVRNQVSDALTRRFPAIRLSNFNQRFDTYELNTEGALAHKPYKNYFDYINEKGILTTNLHGRPIEGTDKLYFTAQSVIEIGNVEEATKELPTAEDRAMAELDTAPQTTVTETTNITPSKPKTNPLGAKKPFKRVKPDIENDNDVLFNLDNNLNTQAENLMRICKSK